MTDVKNDKGLVKLSRFSLLRIEGADAKEFLQGQITLDANRIDEMPRLCAYCDPKGRVLASLILMKEKETYFALIAKNLAEKIAKRLKLYTLRRKVTIAIDERFSLYGALDKDYCNLEARVLHLPFASIVLSESEIDAPLEENFWWEKAILAKFPWVDAKTEGLFIPQSIDFDAWEAITYGKGCYVGQEVVSRIHSLGAPSRKSVLYKGLIKEFNSGIALYDSQKAAQATLVYGVNGYALVECSIKETHERLYTESGIELTRI